MSMPQLLVLEMLAGGRIGVNDAERMLGALNGTVIGIAKVEKVATYEPALIDWAGNGLASVIPIHH